MGGIIERIKAWWTNSSPTQRYTTLGGVAITILLLVGIFSFASKPKYALLYGGLSQEEQASIVTELQAQGVSVKYEVPGQVEVPESEVSKLRMSLTNSGKIPKGAHMGNDSLGSSNLFDTPKVERERLKVIAEGELAKSIETNPGVRSARVHLTIGNDTPFSDQEQSATASISLVTTGPGSITREAGRGIAMLVANSVQGLDMKRVVVLDEKGHALYNGSEMEGVDAIASSKLELEMNMARKEEQRIQNLLDGIYGAGVTRVSVRCEIDMDQRHVKENKRTVKKGAAVKSATETMSGASGGSPGAGLAANNQAPAAIAGTSGDNYVSKVEQTEPNITETTTENERAVGSIKSMVINVAADNKEDRFGDAAKLQSLTDFVQTEVAGKDPSAFIAKVTAMPFDDTGKTQIVQAQTEAASAARMQQILSLLPIGALLIVGIMVVKQISKMGQPTMTSIVAPNGQVLEVPMINGQIPANAILASLQEPSTAGQELSEADSGEALQRSIAKFSEEELAQMTEDGIIYRNNNDILEVEKIKEKKSAHLVAIKQMAKDRPEPTAMLIKTWLTENQR